MSHETHGTSENKTIISFKNSFWLVIIIVGLFIAALNFIQAESGGEEGEHGHGEAKTEMKAHHEATGEHAEKKTEEHATEEHAPVAPATAEGEHAHH